MRSCPQLAWPPLAPVPRPPLLQVKEKEECAALGMGLYLGVAEASDEPPKFIHLTYTPKGALSGDRGGGGRREAASQREAVAAAVA